MTRQPYPAILAASVRRAYHGMKAISGVFVAMFLALLAACAGAMVASNAAPPAGVSGSEAR